jgi:TATA-box binding protein (TBP) (component of TFIID and TFIIIB)
MSKTDQFSIKLERSLKRLRDSTKTIDLSAPDPPKSIYLTNYVTTVRVLKNESELLSLKDICMAAGGACKLKPKSIAASIVRFGDNSLAGNTTALIFKTRKILVVGANGFEHARMASQEYRLFLESIPMLMKDPVTHKLRIDTLEGKTSFHTFGLWNVVAHTTLGVRPDLKKLCELYPQASDWTPELFPGCIFRVWLKKKTLCKCKSKKKNGSCKCNCTCLVSCVYSQKKKRRKLTPFFLRYLIQARLL